MRCRGIALVASLILFAPTSAVVRAEPPAPAPAPAPVPVAVEAGKPARTLVMVSVEIVEATPRAARSLRLLATARRPGDTPACDPAALKRRVDCWTRAGHVKTLLAPRLLTLPGQTGTVTVGERVSYVEDFEIETGMGGPVIANPVIQTVLEGTLLEFRGDVVPGGVAATASLAFSDVLSPIPEVEVPVAVVGAGTKVKIQVPEVNIRRVERRLLLAPGRAVLLADLPPAPPEHAGYVLAWIEAHTVTEPASDPSTVPAAPPAPARPR